MVSKPEHKTKAFQETCKTGRVEKYLVDFGWEKMLFVYNIYGQSGGSKEDIAVTQAILAVIKTEMVQEQHLPVIIMGDANANPEKLGHIIELVEDEAWIDVGLHADWWGGIPAENTCGRRPGAKPSRIDIVVASLEAASYITDVWVRKDPATPTHVAVGVALTRNAMQREMAYARRLPALKQINKQEI